MRVGFVFDGVPYGADEGEPVESEPELTKESEQQMEMMVRTQREQTIKEEREEEEQYYDAKHIFEIILPRNCLVQRKRCRVFASHFKAASNF